MPKLIAKLKNKHFGTWLPHYLERLLRPGDRVRQGDVTHLMFLFVDHFELAGHASRLKQWTEGYPRLAGRHRDADGSPPKHSWFYALDLIHEEELAAMRLLAEQGLGEVDLHWHHSHDTPESFRSKLRAGLEVFQRYGFMKPVRPGQAGCFGFIHGNWSLDNARGDHFCGVNNELDLLLEAGCYADFTFPALFSTCQPSLTNCIYYAKDDPRPKSYDRGRPMTVGGLQGDDELMIFQGPLTINWRDWHFKWHPRFESGEINGDGTQSQERRIDSWVRQRIHLPGRPDWVFVKVFCHGGQDCMHIVGEQTDRMFSYLEERYNDGTRYQLHYVTAREAYNIAKAAEAGCEGNPNDYRDYLIPHPSVR